MDKALPLRCWWEPLFINLDNLCFRFPASCIEGGLPGDICPDGSMIAGLSPDGNQVMYTTRCDKGQVWDGSSCIGTRQTTTWNNGSWNTTGYTSSITGKNTENLAILADAGSPKVAQYCADLIEMDTTTGTCQQRRFNQLWLNFGSGKTHTSVGNFDVSGQTYWSSSEYNYQYAWIQRLSDGYQGNRKSYGYLLRCVRSGTGGVVTSTDTPAAFAFTAQTGWVLIKPFRVTLFL